jgi:hypothetical protein
VKNIEFRRETWNKRQKGFQEPEEVETFLLLAKDLGYLSEGAYAVIEEKRGETTRLLRGLIKSLLPS